MSTDPTGNKDLPDSPFTPVYFMSSMQHGTARSDVKGSCQQFQNPLDSQAVQRVLFAALDKWATAGIGSAAGLGHSLSGLAFAQASGASGVKVEKNIGVGNGGDTELRCDIYRPPAGTEKRIALVHFHGGGFARGARTRWAIGSRPSPRAATYPSRRNIA